METPPDFKQFKQYRKTLLWRQGEVVIAIRFFGIFE